MSEFTYELVFENLGDFQRLITIPSDGVFTINAKMDGNIKRSLQLDLLKGDIIVINHSEDTILVTRKRKNIFFLRKGVVVL